MRVVFIGGEGMFQGFDMVSVFEIGCGYGLMSECGVFLFCFWLWCFQYCFENGDAFVEFVQFLQYFSILYTEGEGDCPGTYPAGEAECFFIQFHGLFRFS